MNYSELGKMAAMMVNQVSSTVPRKPIPAITNRNTPWQYGRKLPKTNATTSTAISADKVPGIQPKPDSKPVGLHDLG